LSIIDDYVEILDGGVADGEKVDQLAEKIPPETFSLIRDLDADAPLRSAERNIQIRFSAAINYLKKFDSDPRRRIVSAFESMFQRPISSRVVFRWEASSLQHLRMSFLNADNEEFLRRICSRARPRLWAAQVTVHGSWRTSMQTWAKRSAGICGGGCDWWRTWPGGIFHWFDHHEGSPCLLA